MTENYGQEKDPKALGFTDKLLSALLPALFATSNIFLFGSFNIYQGNLRDFSYPFFSIIGQYVTPWLSILGLLTMIGIVLPRRVHTLFASCIFTLGALTWLQGNIIPWSYGKFDGSSIDWSIEQWRGWVDGGICIALILVSVLFSRHIAKLARSGSLAMLLLQLIFSVYVGVTRPDLWDTEFPEPGVTPEWAGEFSSELNVIHLVLDGVQTDVFQHIMAEDSTHYKEALEGFTFFPNATGHYQSTHFSIPASVSGKLYQNDVPMKQFIRETFAGNTTVNFLHDSGFEVDVVPWSLEVPRARADHYYAIPSPYSGSMSEFIQSKSTLLLDLTLFRHAPHRLKQVIYNDQKWLFQKSFVTDERMQFRRFGDEHFLIDITDNLVVNRDRPVYKFYHLEFSHPPFVTSEDCEYAGEVLPINRQTITDQIRCTLGSVITFLEKLKVSGIYENALIIIQADHGYVAPVRLRQSPGQTQGYELAPYMVGTALPLLLVKEPHRSGEMSISQAQVMLMDIPATIASTLKLKHSFPGKSAFEVGPKEVRQREFNYFHWAHADFNADFLPPMDKYIISGDVFERGSWHLQTDPKRKQSKPSMTIDLGTQDADKYLISGWSYKELNPEDETMTVTWATGKSASVRYALPRSSFRLRAHLKSNFYVGQQLVRVIVDGKDAGRWKNAKWGEWEYLDLTVQANPARPPLSVIEFTFSSALEPKGDEYRWLAMLFDGISIN